MLCRVRCGPLIFAGVRVVLPALASRPFVSMPSRKIGDDWEPLISILNPMLNDAISNAVLAEYRRGSR
jgi:DNA-binding cell septation regulator SpoVG